MGSIILLYRTIYFRPKLALDWKIPIAALVGKFVTSCQIPKELTFIKSDILPNPDCLPGLANYYLLEFGLNKISETNKWNDLPESVGPHFELGKSRPLPEVKDGIAWVRQNALPFREE